MEKQSDNSIDWDEVIVRLESFTRSFLKNQHWFRGGNASIYLKGKEMRDYVYEGIGRYLRNPEKYDPEKGDLASYLKYNLIRSLISNDTNSEENLTNKDVFVWDGLGEDGDDKTPYLDRILPCIEPLFIDELEYSQIKEYIETRIEGDKIMEEIFLGIFSSGMKRREIIEEFKMSERDYNNGIRRLQTILTETTAIFKAITV